MEHCFACRGEVCLIDGGSSSKKQIWKELDQTLRYYGVSTVDYIFLSHADADHTNGIEQYLQGIEQNLTGKNSHGITLKNLVLPPTAGSEDFQKIRELGRGEWNPGSSDESGQLRDPWHGNGELGVFLSVAESIGTYRG